MKKYLVLTFIVMLVGIFMFSTAQGPVLKIRLFDTNRSHYADLIWNEDETVANRAINWVLNGADRTINLSANLTLTSAGAALIDDANAAAQRTTLELGTGNDVQFADIYATDFIGNDLVDNGNSGASITIDWNAGNFQKVTLTAAGVDVTFTEPPHVGWCFLYIYQDGTGSRTIDWTHEVNPYWPGGVALTLSTAASSIDLVAIHYLGGTMYVIIGSLDFKQ